MNDQELLERCHHMLELGEHTTQFAKFDQEGKVISYLHPPLVCNNRLEEEALPRYIYCNGCNRWNLYNWLHNEDEDLDLCVYCVLRLLRLCENRNVVVGMYVQN